MPDFMYKFAVVLTAKDLLINIEIKVTASHNNIGITSVNLQIK